MRFYDYKGGTLVRKIFGFPLIRKDNVITLLVFGFPLVQKAITSTWHLNGGGGAIINYRLMICGITISRKQVYDTYYILHQNAWFENILPTLQAPNILSRLQALTKGLDTQSTNRVYQIIARTIEASQSPTKSTYKLTQEERESLDKIYCDFYPSIACLKLFAENQAGVYFWNGYFLPKRHSTEVFWHRHGLDTLKNPAYLQGKDIIDAGGYIGDSALILQEYTDKNVHSFEATKRNFTLMQETLKLNNTTRIIPVNKGLGSKPDKMSICLKDSASSLISGSSLPDHFQSDEHEEIEIITLDSYVAEHNLRVGFIKVDIEGFELEFLKGAKNTICTQKPAMLISIYHNIEHFLEIKPMLESWNLGYTFHIYKPLDRYIADETALFCEILD